MSLNDPIRKIELTPVYIPFREAIKQILQSGSGNVAMSLNVDDHWLGGDFLVCQMTTQSGVVGVGEVYVWMVETGVTPTMMAHTIKDHLARYVLGQSAFDIRAIQNRMNNNVARNEVAKGLIDITLYDLAARSIGRPVHDLIGGKQTDKIPLCQVLPLSSDEVVLGLASMAVNSGVNTLRCKLGDSISRDVEIIRGVREVLGPDGHIRVDYNQAYNPDQAVRAINAIEPYGIDYAEQPIAANDFTGMAYVQSRTNVPVMAHEGAFGLKDIITLAEMGGVRVFGLNAERPGGMTDALKAIDYASSRGLGVALHNQPTGLGSAMLLHLAAARANDIDYATELQGHIMLEHDLLQKPINYDDKGFAHVPECPGWGVDLDHDALKEYATSETIILESS